MREKQLVADEKLDRDWKQTLAEIRAGLPIVREAPPPSRRGDTVKQRKDRDRELLMALCERQEWKCFWCGLLMTNGETTAPSYRTLEHVIARSSGLSIVNHLTNLRAACAYCNSMRGQMAHMKQIVGQLNQVKALLDGARATIQRHKATMAGRCYYCKWRFYVKEWLHKHGITRR